MQQFNLGQILFAQRQVKEAVPHRGVVIRRRADALTLFTLAQAEFRAGETQKRIDSAQRTGRQPARIRRASYWKKATRF